MTRIRSRRAAPDPSAGPTPAAHGAAADGPDVTALLGFRLFRLSNTLGLSAERRYIGEFGISLAEWRCLSVVDGRVATTVVAVAEHLGIDKAWVSRTLARLQQRGLVQGRRDPADARRVEYRTTRPGQACARGILAAAQRRHHWLLAGLTQQQARTLLRALDVLQVRAQRLLDDTRNDGVGAPRGRSAPGTGRSATARSLPGRSASAQRPAAARSAAALSVRSQVNSGSSRPKWP